MRILVLADHYLPGFRAGGPIRTLANLVDRLGREYEFRIVARDRDLGDMSPYPGVETGVWKREARAEIFYLEPGLAGLRQIHRLLAAGDYDLLYLNSAFSPARTLWPLLLQRLRLAPRRSCLIAPRGEFAAGALATKGVKKQTFLNMARLFGLYDDVAWQTSSSHDAADLRHQFDVPQERLFIVPNLPRRSEVAPRSVRPASPGLSVVFLGRVAPIKNLDYALDVLSRVDEPVSFTIYGPIEDHAYWHACQARMARLPPQIRARYAGEVSPEQVSDVVSKHDLLLLPTRGENFGHVIAECLQAGTPVLISDQTPWRDLEAANAGWDLPLAKPEAFISAITRLARESDQDRAERRRAAAAFADLMLDPPRIEQATRRMFELCANCGAARHQGLSAHLNRL